MNTLAIVSLLSLLGWLALMLMGWRSQRVGSSASLKMAFIWIGVFLGATLVMSLIAS